MQEARKVGYKIKLYNQSPKSLDLNVLDLGFFRFVQSLQEKKCTRNFDNLIIAVQLAFDRIEFMDLVRNLVTLKEIMKLVLINSSMNHFYIYHV